MGAARASALETFTIPIILLTADDSKDIRAQAFGLSAGYYLAQPFKPDELLRKVKEALSQ
ncbi:MAG: hypothetical protein V1789_08040 [PVC group bacterium]